MRTANRSKGVVVLGSTGSVGASTLDVLARHKNRYQVIGLAANKNVNSMMKQCKTLFPKFAVMFDDKAALELESNCRREGLETEVLSGESGIRYIAALEDADIVMAAIVGAAGLLPALDAVRGGKRVLIANKEPLVMLGGLFVQEARRAGATILPIDSEHNAIFQCLPLSCSNGLPIPDKPSNYGIRKIILTASGGPFRDCQLEELRYVTPEQACNHPNWVMGKKISVDSATMMNKGLEIIEACWLFNLKPENVDVVIHPQSIVHSLVEYIDGSILAHLGSPDMRIPIAHALAWPERIASGSQTLNLCDLGTLDFQPPQLERFPCLRIAREVAHRGGTAPAIANAANEVAVDLFLAGELQFTAIPRLIADTLENVTASDVCDMESVLEADAKARIFAQQKISTGLWRQNINHSGATVP